MRLKRIIYCSYKDFEFLKARYPKREVIPSIYAKDGKFDYYGRNGRLRTVVMSEGRIFGWDDLEKPYLSYHLKREFNPNNLRRH